MILLLKSAKSEKRKGEEKISFQFGVTSRRFLEEKKERRKRIHIKER